MTGINPFLLKVLLGKYFITVIENQTRTFPTFQVPFVSDPTLNPLSWLPGKTSSPVESEVSRFHLSVHLKQLSYLSCKRKTYEENFRGQWRAEGNRVLIL